MNYLQVYGAVIISALIIFIDDCPVLIITCSNKKIHLVMHLKQNSVLSNYIAFECVDINVL